MHIFFKCVLLDPLIPPILLLPWPVVLMYLSTIAMHVNCSTDNSHIVFTHLYCLLHSYAVSYIIPYSKNNLFVYIQWMNIFMCSNVVDALWADSSEKCVWKFILIFFPDCLHQCDLYCNTRSYLLILIECGWIQMNITEFPWQIIPSVIHNSHVLSSRHYFLPNNILLYYSFTHVWLVIIITSYDIHTSLTMVDNVPY